MLHSIKTEHSLQLSQFNRQMQSLEREVEKYRILVGIEQLARHDEQDIDAAAHSVTLSRLQTELVAVGTQCEEIVDNSVTSLRLAVDDSSTQTPDDWIIGVDLHPTFCELERTTTLSKLRLTDSAAELSSSSLSLESYLPASECLLDAAWTTRRLSLSSVSSVENARQCLLTSDMDVFLSDSNPAQLQTPPATQHSSPIRVSDALPPPPPPPPLPNNFGGKQQNRPLAVTGPVGFFPPPPPPLPPNFGTPLGRPVVLRDAIPPAPPPPPPPFMGLLSSLPSSSSLSSSTWSLPGTPVMTRRRSTPVPLSEMKPLFWKKIPNSELAAIAASTR